MTLNITLPQNTQAIFEILKSGKFLCDNHPESRHRKYHQECLNYYSELKNLFQVIGLDLVKEEGGRYFYFSDFNTADSDEQQIEKKLKNFTDYIRLFSILNEIYEYFDAGFTFTLGEVEYKVIETASFRGKFKTKDGEQIRKQIAKDIRLFTSAGYFYLSEPKHDKYIVLSSIQRLKSFIGDITIRDEIFDEIDEIVKEGDKDNDE